MWSAVANDKLLAHAVLAQCNFPIPKLYALYHPFRQLAGWPCLRTPEQLAAFIRNEATFPFVAKPIWGISGHDVNVVKSIDLRSDTVLLGDGREEKIDSFSSHRESFRGNGHLLQEWLRPSPEIHQLCGDRICSVRVVVLVDDSGPELLAAFWKVATGSNMTDNYHKGRAGNIIATVDIGNGQVIECVHGRGLTRKVVTQHPDTGAVLCGTTLPDWPLLKQLCIDGAATLPGIRMQAWDVALTDRGPVLLEVNVIGGMDLPQVATNRGLYQGRLKQFLDQFGLK